LQRSTGFLPQLVGSAEEHRSRLAWPAPALEGLPKTALAMVYKLTDAAQKSWRRLDGPNQLPKLIQGVKFTDGVEVISPQTQAAA
jgi:hypothetical protein